MKHKTPSSPTASAPPACGKPNPSAPLPDRKNQCAISCEKQTPELRPRDSGLRTQDAGHKLPAPPCYPHGVRSPTSGVPSLTLPRQNSPPPSAAAPNHPKPHSAADTALLSPATNYNISIQPGTRKNHQLLRLPPTDSVTSCNPGLKNGECQQSPPSRKAIKTIPPANVERAGMSGGSAKPPQPKGD